MSAEHVWFLFPGCTFKLHSPRLTFWPRKWRTLCEPLIPANLKSVVETIAQKALHFFKMSEKGNSKNWNAFIFEICAHCCCTILYMNCLSYHTGFLTPQKAWAMSFHKVLLWMQANFSSYCRFQYFLFPQLCRLSLGGGESEVKEMDWNQNMVAASTPQM